MTMVSIWAAMYFLVGGLVAVVDQNIAPEEERSLGGFLTVMCLWPILVATIVFDVFSSTPQQ